MSSLRAFEQKNIYLRSNAKGTLVYVVRIRDQRESSGLWYNGTFHDLELAKRIRDLEEARLFLDKQNGPKV
jgi:hypothetical protein